MSNFITKIQQKIAARRIVVHDLTCQHITSNDFFYLKPVYIKECIPGEKLHVHMRDFSRLDALNKPFFGNPRMVNRAFFVPCRTIMQYWNEFIEQSVINEGLNPYIRSKATAFTAHDFVKWLLGDTQETGYRLAHDG